MKEPFLYQKIFESIRLRILEGELKPGDRLPAVRDLTQEWGCTTGTIQRAYSELAKQGLVVSRPGQGTRITGSLPQTEDTPLRRAALVHRAEAFLLEVLTAGYHPDEIEQSFRLALDRWRITEQTPTLSGVHTVRFSGSHDLAVDWLAANFRKIAPGYSLDVSFGGSLAGLIALAEGNADLAGSHLWDAESGEYNAPFVRRLLPNRRVALVTLAYRRLGLVLPPGNPDNIRDLAGLAQPGVRFINRQSGSGTRVWLDTTLQESGIDPAAINGYAQIAYTHSDVARAVAEKHATAGLALEATARAYGLDFIFMTRERYDLVIPAESMEKPALRSLLDWLQHPETHSAIAHLGGYDAHETGKVNWVG